MIGGMILADASISLVFEGNLWKALIGFLLFGVLIVSVLCLILREILYYASKKKSDIKKDIL